MQIAYFKLILVVKYFLLNKKPQLWKNYINYF